MGIKNDYNDLKQFRGEAQQIMTAQGLKPSVLSMTNLGTFFQEIGYAFALIMREKEILFFAVMQWVVISIAYSMWTQILDVIPDSVWQAVAKASEEDRDSGFQLIGMVLLGWSFIVVVLASYPLALLNAAIIAVHFLNSRGVESTIPKAIAIASRQMGRQWTFTAIDAWITVWAILDRMPRKRNNRKLTDELLYYAWKIGTFGIMPGLVAGKGFIEAGKTSIMMLKDQPGRVLGVRMGYSLIAWIVGITAYIGAIYWFCVAGDDGGIQKANALFNFYTLMILPIALSVGFLAVFIRPFFMIMLARLYTEQSPYIEPAKDSHPHEGSNFVTAIFVLSLMAFLGVFLFGEQLGLHAWVESLAARDFARGAG